MDRKVPANVRPPRVFTWTWLIPSNWYSTGSSTVTMLISFERRFAIIEYSVVVFPEPVGPVNKIIPCGWLRQSINVENCHSEKPNASKFGMDVVPKTLMTTFSPKSDGRVETRRSAD